MRTVVSVLIISVAFIIGLFLIGKAYNYKFQTRNTINVVGSADYNFTADLIVWSARFTRSSYTLQEAYSAIKSDEQTVRSYLKNHNIPDSEIIFSSIVIDKMFDYNYDERGRQTGSVFKGYQLQQSVKINSKQITSVEKISREITELLQSGIELSSQEPYYYYTKLSDLKIDLLARASADAKERATTVAKNANSSLGKLRKASMGVFQITGQYSNENYTYGGAFNVVDKDKTATITVRLEYELD